MAKRGFRSRIRSILHTVLPSVVKKNKPEPPKAPPPPKPPPPPPPPPSPPPSPPGGGGGGGPPVDRDRDYKQVWMEHTASRPGRKYRLQLETFLSVPGVVTETTNAERLELWGIYVEYMVNGRERRNSPDNPFWRAVGIDPRDFDWDEFRTALGYKRRA